MKRIAKLVVSAVLIGGVAGCGTQRPSGTAYVNPGAVVAGDPGQPTMYDLESSAQALIQKMLAHPQFARNYNAAKEAKGGKLPVLCLSLLKNETTLDVRSKLRAVDDTVRVMLFDTARFEVKDDEAADTILSRIVWGADGGIENTKDLMNALGTHDAPDFIVSGDLRHISDAGGYHTYRLRIAIHSLWTGKIVWEGIQTRVKL